MRYIKKTLKILFKSLLVFFGFVGVYLLAAFVCKYITVNDNYQEPKDGVEVFLVSNGVHTDICLPLSKNDTLWNNYFDRHEFTTLKEQPKYISFGWGDKGFYLETPTWDDLTVSTAVNATFLPSPTALHVTYKIRTPKLSTSTKSFFVSREGLTKIEEYILSYVKLEGEKSVLIDCCQYPGIHDNFYDAHGNYNLFQTCNVWTNNAIKAAGVKTSVWAPFQSSILYQFD